MAQFKSWLIEVNPGRRLLFDNLTIEGQDIDEVREQIEDNQRIGRRAPSAEHSSRQRFERYHVEGTI